jgi:hypothetical protein
MPGKLAGNTRLYQQWPNVSKPLNIENRTDIGSMLVIFVTSDYRWANVSLLAGSLDTRRVRGDLIEVFKIMKGLEDVNIRKNFLLWIKGVQGVTNLSYLSLTVA